MQPGTEEQTHLDWQCEVALREVDKKLSGRRTGSVEASGFIAFGTAACALCEAARPAQGQWKFTGTLQPFGVG